jgi:hypothetical protein
MSTIAELRDRGRALPGVEEGTHFRLPAFRVGGAIFVVLQSDDHAVLHVDAATAEAVAAHPAIEKVYRGTALVRVRVRLPDFDGDTLRSLVTAAWHHRANVPVTDPLRNTRRWVYRTAFMRPLTVRCAVARRLAGVQIRCDRVRFRVPHHHRLPRRLRPQRMVAGGSLL